MDLLNKIITITGIETKSTISGKVFFKVKDQDNKSYQLWQTKADGTQSIAYSHLNEIGGAMAVGKSVEISYKEEQGEYQGKTVTYKTIVNLKLTTQSKGQTMVNLQRAEASKKSDDDKWAEISRGKVRHGVACEFIRLGQELTPSLVNKINRWTDFIMSGQLLSDKSELDFNEEKETPTELRADQIPF